MRCEKFHIKIKKKIENIKEYGCGKKKRNLPTRTTKSLSEQEREEKRRARGRRGSKNYKARRREMIKQAFGSVCFICAGTAYKNNNIVIHEKNGNPHKILIHMGKKELQKEIENNRENYVALCYLCHNKVHWAMKYLGMNWAEIEEKVRRVTQFDVRVSVL